MLRAVQGHSAPRPILKGLRVTDSYMRRMPSFPKGVTKTQFILEDGSQGKFNHSVMHDVVVADNIYDLPGLDTLSGRSTRARRSVRVADTTLVKLDFSDQLLFGWDSAASKPKRNLPVVVCRICVCDPPSLV